jgi:hypothetical protein
LRKIENNLSQIPDEMRPNTYSPGHFISIIAQSQKPLPGKPLRRSHSGEPLVKMQLNVKRDAPTRRLADAATHVDALEVPRAIGSWFERLSDRGHPSQLVGECVLQLALGLRPNHYRAHSPISQDSLLSLAPRAIPTRVEPATVTIPTAAGPLDVVTNRSLEETLVGLRAAPFTLLALALDPQRGELIAQDQTREDLVSRTLTPFRDARDRSPEGSPDHDDDGFALEAARLISLYGLSPTSALLDAARKRPIQAAPGSATSHRRRTLREMLLAPGVRAGLTFLRDSGAEQALAPGVRQDAAAIAAGVPAEPRIRFCAWLQGASARDLLRDLHFGGEFSSGLHRLLEVHPIDEWVAPDRGARLRRLLKRLSQAEIADLLLLRRAEALVLRESTRPEESDLLLRRLEQIEQRLVQLREQQRRRRERTPLSISGGEIMRILACPPGPEIGRAIRFLEGTIADDPGTNTPEALSRALEHWQSTR